MRLLILTPCEKVLHDPISGISLISTFQELTAHIPQGAEWPPTNAVIPKDWVLYSHWAITEQEIGTPLEQITEIYWPSGDLFVRQTLTVSPSPEKPDWVSFSMRMLAFPMGQVGRLRVRVWVEKESQAISEIVETTISVKLLRQEMTA